MKKFWSMSQGAGACDLYIQEEIASQESWWSDTVTPQQLRWELAQCSGELHVWLNSPGGDAFAGAAIYDMLREYSTSGRGKVVAMVSLAASAASLIAMAADEIRISVLGTVMIHEPWSMTAGREAQLRATADVLASVREAQIDAYARRTHNSREKILELMQGTDGEGTYMNATQAIQLGFADCLMHDDGSVWEDAGDLGGNPVRSLDRARVLSCLERQQDNAAQAARATEAAQAETDAARRALFSALVDSYD